MEKKNKLFWWEVAGFIFCSLMTVVVHMLYEWTGYNVLVTPFVAVSESIYEHTKLLITPFLLFAVVEYFCVRGIVSGKRFWATKLGLIALAPIVLAIIYYSYSGIIGDNFMAIDIFIGQLIVAIMCYISYKILMYDIALKAPYVWIICGIIVVALQVIFTYFPPNIAWFISP